jgi:hypothetical protein
MAGEKTACKSRADALRLFRFWMSGDIQAFHSLADDLVSLGRQDLLDEAVLKLQSIGDADRVAEFICALSTVAEMAYTPLPKGDIVSVDIFTVAAIARRQDLPSSEQMLESLRRSGMFPGDCAIRLAAGFCDASEITSMTACSTRELLTRIACGLQPNLQFASSREQNDAEAAVWVFVGVSSRRCAQTDTDDVSVLSDDTEEMDDAYEAWRLSMKSGQSPGLQPIGDVVRPCCPSMLKSELRTHLAELREWLLGTSDEETRMAALTPDDTEKKRVLH